MSRTASVLSAAVALATVGAGAFVFRATGGVPTLLDSWWYSVMASHRAVVTDAVGRALNLVGGTLVMTLVTATVVLVLLIARRWHAAIIVGLSVPLASGAHSLLKLVAARPRPLGGIVDAGTTSYPSGHTTSAAAFAVAVVLALAITRAWAWALAATWILAMAFSRTYLLVHWMTDVAAGAALGASVALLIALGVRALVPSPGARSTLV